ncbi:MAG: hypothetical protein LBI53_04790 [Candidatus Peribacteria bacterium]|nr:hypothetical protein [Candidatus Peribacteria bacterium]
MKARNKDRRFLQEFILNNNCTEIMESELPLRDQHNQLFIPFEEIETVYNLNESNERWDQSKNILHALTMNEILYNLFRLITDREYLQHKKQALEEMFGSEEEHGEAGKIRDYAILHRETSDALIWALELDVRAKKDLEEITNQQKEKKKLFYKYL